MKAQFPAHPVPATKGYIPICNGDQLRSSAGRFRNCSRSHLVRILESRAAFAEVVAENGCAVVHLVNGKNEWVLDDVYGVENEPPPPMIEAVAIKYLAQFGIKPAVRRQIESDWAPLRRVLGQFEYEH